jgi:epoxide hydrolase 4
VGLVRGLGYEKAAIVGHDWGGVLAWNFALTYPEMTERLIVLNAPHPQAFAREIRTLKQLRKSWYTFFFQIPFIPELLLGLNRAEMIGYLLQASAVQKDAFGEDVQAHYREAMSKPGALTSGLNYYRAAFSALRGAPTLSSRNAIIEAPTLLIWGEQDVALGIDLTKNIEQWVPHLQIRYIPDSGHWVQQEKPELVNQWMLEFLQGHSRIQAVLES